MAASLDTHTHSLQLIGYCSSLYSITDIDTGLSGTSSFSSLSSIPPSVPSLSLSLTPRVCSFSCPPTRPLSSSPSLSRYCHSCRLSQSVLRLLWTDCPVLYCTATPGLLLTLSFVCDSLLVQSGTVLMPCHPAPESTCVRTVEQCSHLSTPSQFSFPRTGPLSSHSYFV